MWHRFAIWCDGWQYGETRNDLGLRMPAAARSFRDIIRSLPPASLILSFPSATTCLIREPSNKRREMFSINPILRMTVVLYRRMWRPDSLVAFAHLYSAGRRANSSCDRASLHLLPPAILPVVSEFHPTAAQKAWISQRSRFIISSPPPLLFSY